MQYVKIVLANEEERLSPGNVITSEEDQWGALFQKMGCYSTRKGHGIYVI